MLDFEKIAELYFITCTLDEPVILDNGMVITKENVGNFINNVFDA